MKHSVEDVLEFADRFFMGTSHIHEAARSLQHALEHLGVPFAVAGALAVGAHGHRRTTEDVDILMTPEGLARFKDRWLGRGWVERFPGSKGLRHTVTNVKIDVLLTGDYPGDGKPKPISFPEPTAAAQPGAEGFPVLKLPVLLELKLASGMTAAHRLQDLADVIQLIRVNALAPDYAERLDPFVRDEYRRLWEAAQVEEDY